MDVRTMAAVVYQMATNNVNRPRQFGIFAALGMSQGNADETGEDGNVPEYRTEHTEFVAVNFGPQQFREIVKGGGQQPRCDKSEQNGVDMHGSHPSEMDILDICQEVRGTDHAKGCRGGKP